VKQAAEEAAAGKLTEDEKKKIIAGYDIKQTVFKDLTFSIIDIFRKNI